MSRQPKIKRPKRLGPKRSIKIKLFWASLWKKDPEAMHDNRRQGIKASVKKRAKDTNEIRAIVSTWPQTMTTTEFWQRVEYVASTISPTRRRRRYRPDSLRRRICSAGFVRHDQALAVWVNLVHSRPL